MMIHFPRFTKLTVTAAVGLALSGCSLDEANNLAQDNTTIKLRVMETTDLHGTMMPYNYFSGAIDSKIGLARTAVTIEQARQEVVNSMLFDNGDLIQGTPMADYMASLGAEHFKDSATIKEHRHAVFKAMNLLDYDAANLGNHEFNYGIPFLENVLKGANFPYMSANVFAYDPEIAERGFSEKTCEPRVDAKFFEKTQNAFADSNIKPYYILEREFVDTKGKKHLLNVGLIGFTPPNIMSWDKNHLECKLMVADIKQTAEYFVPKMKAEGADIIIAIPHSGLDGSQTEEPFFDNATWHLAKVEGIDAIMFGHDHKNFPTTSGAYDHMEGVDAPKGKIFGKPAVMPGYWGNHLGVIDLHIDSNDDGKTWQVDHAKSTAELRALPENKEEVSTEIVNAVAEDHAGTQAYMQEPILPITQKINSFFSAVVPDLSVQIVNEAQFFWAKNQANAGNFVMEEGAILLSVSAPFKGGRGGANDYTNITGENLTNASVADLYVFDNNTPAVLKLTVADMKEWLELVASQQYKTVTKEGDALLHQNFRSYNFDVFYGGWDDANKPIDLHYNINVANLPRYKVNQAGELGETPMLDEADNRRIEQLTYKGKPLADEQIIYVVTNNYRASQTSMPGVKNAELVFADGAYSNRVLVDNYLNHLAQFNKPYTFINAKNFDLTGLKEGMSVEFLSSPNGKEFAATLPQVTATDGVGNVGDNTGYSKYYYQFRDK